MAPLMPRAVARVNLAAIERNARACAAAGRDRGAVRGRQGRRLRPRRGARRAGRARRRRELAGGRRGGGGGRAARRRDRRAAPRHGRAVARGARRRAGGATPTSSPGARRSSPRSRRAAAGRVHVKLDTGHGPAGHARPGRGDARRARPRRAPTASSSPGLMTHFATADERGDAFFGEQLARFSAVGAGRCAPRTRARRCTPPTARRTLRDPAAHFDLVRAGIAIYGLDPFQQDPAAQRARARAGAASPTSPRSSRCAPGESAGYGRRFVAERDTRPRPRCRSATATACAAR